MNPLAVPRQTESADKSDALQTLRASGRVNGRRVSVWSACGFSAAFPRQAAIRWPGRLLESLDDFDACIGTLNPPLTPPRRGTGTTRTNIRSPPGRGRGWVGSWKGSAGFTTSTVLQRVKQVTQKQHIVALDIVHAAAHAR